ncbi:MAG TPA: YegP family protein [Saprospiraceae bacterium]|nr:YegP family protein [Saprospiraceae bacterium]
MAKFEITKRKNGDFQFNLKANNGEVILTSQGYKSKLGCTSGIHSVKTNAANDSRYELKTAANGKFHFNLKAQNGRVIGSSEMYSSEAARNNGVSSVKSNAPGAQTVDLTV